MAVDDPQLRFATHTELADGVKTDFEVNFVGGYINTDHVLCVSVLVDEDTGLTSDRQIHLTEVLSSSGNAATVRVAPAVAAGRMVIIFRSTPKTAALVQYLNGSIISKENMDLANKQLLMLIQEMLDNLNENSLTINEAIETIIDINELIQNIYETVLTLLENAGIIISDPRTWSWTTDDATTDYLMPGAEVEAAGYYDTYLDGKGLNPATDFSVILDAEDPEQTTLRLAVLPPEGVELFTVLRGYAKPYTGPAPINSLDMPVVDAEGPTYHADEAARWALVRCLHEDGCEVTIKEINPINEDRLKTGSYMSFLQRNVAPVTVIGDPGVTLLVPGGCLPQTRASGSVISATCEDADGNFWVLSGDLAQE